MNELNELNLIKKYLAKKLSEHFKIKPIKNKINLETSKLKFHMREIN